MVELVDTLVLGTSAARHGGSSPSTPTKSKNQLVRYFDLVNLVVWDEKVGGATGAETGSRNLPIGKYL